MWHDTCFELYDLNPPSTMQTSIPVVPLPDPPSCAPVLEYREACGWMNSYGFIDCPLCGQLAYEF